MWGALGTYKRKGGVLVDLALVLQCVATITLCWCLRMSDNLLRVYQPEGTYRVRGWTLALVVVFSSIQIGIEIIGEVMQWI